MPAGFVHNPQQELRRVEKARRPNISRSQDQEEEARRRSQSPLSQEHSGRLARCCQSTLSRLQGLATTCAACSSCPECPHTGSEFGQQPSQPYTSPLHFETQNLNENYQTSTNKIYCCPSQEDFPHPRVYIGSEFSQQPESQPSLYSPWCTSCAFFKTSICQSATNGEYKLKDFCSPPSAPHPRVQKMHVRLILLAFFLA